MDSAQLSNAAWILAATADFVAAPSRPELVRELVHHCARTLGLDHVHLARRVPGQRELRTEAVWRDGELLANCSYDLLGTPCDELSETSRCCIPSGARRRFPNDPMLGQLAAEGYVHEPVLDLSGRLLGVIVGMTRQPLRAPELAQACLRILAMRAGAELAWRCERVSLNASEHRCCQYDDRSCNDASGPLGGETGDCVDVTARHQALEAVSRERRFRQALFDNFPFMIWLKSPDGRFLVVNQAFADAAQAPSVSWMLGKTDFDVWPHELAERYCADDARVLASREKIQVEEEIVQPGGRKWFETFKAPVVDPDGALIGCIGFARDISNRKEAEKKIHQLAYFDPLTDLPNRRLLMDRLQHALATSNRTRQYGALLMLDLDHFKELNDTRGHDVGDRLLAEVAQRLTRTLRKDATVSRLGGDEYVVVIEGLDLIEETAANAAELIAEKVQAAINAPYDLGGGTHWHHCSSSIGLTLFRGLDASAEVLLKQADVALYQAKDAGRDTLRFFNPAMQTAIEQRIALEAALRQAVSRDELQLFYQPQMDQAGHCFGAEALLRWQRPGVGLVPPSRFIPLAEQTGLILPIGRWVLEAACEQLKAWERDPNTRSLQLAINVSARQFHQADFVSQVRECTERTGANPERLKLELTESVVLSNAEAVILRMQQLKALGVGFSLDDFGTGYSSLSYLKRLPLDQLKIDQSFVRDVTSDPNDAAIVKAILALSRSLGLQTVAEGVESLEQKQFLEASGCRAFQGDLFGKPMPIQAWRLPA